MPDPSGRYIDYAFLTKFWGVRQIDAWADVDSDAVRGAADNDAIQEAITDGEDDVDAYLAAVYAVPFEGTIPRMIKKIARLRAGIYLYTRRGLREGPDLVGQMKAWWDLSDALLSDLRSGLIRLPGIARAGRVGFGTAGALEPNSTAAADRVFTREKLE
jgi:phage gp36-like protein